MTDSGRDTAYAALVDALIALRRDPATERFDEYLAYAQETGRIDSPTARALRWWQRQSVRGVGDHLDGILPALLVQLEAADQAAIRAVDVSDLAWRAAAGQTINADPQPPQSPLVDKAPPEPTTVQPPEPAHERPVTSVYAELVADTQPHNLSDLLDVGESALTAPGANTASSGDGDSVDVTPLNEHYSEYPAETMESRSQESGAPVRRTLTAGLTVIPEGPNGQ